MTHSLRFIGHPLESEFKVPAWDILEAISHGFRAKVDAKGKIAELLLGREHLKPLLEEGLLSAIVWNDKDGLPDSSGFLAIAAMGEVKLLSPFELPGA